MCIRAHFAVHLYVHMSLTLCTCANVCMCLWEFVSVYNYTCAHGIVKVAICSGEVSIQVIRVLIICSAFQEQATVGDL